MVKSVLFTRFYGTIEGWNFNIEHHRWDNTIVFGKMWNQSGNKWEYKIYAGNVYSSVSAQNINFIYDIPSNEQMEYILSSIEQHGNSIDEILNTLSNIDTSIGNLIYRVDTIEKSLQWININ